MIKIQRLLDNIQIDVNSKNKKIEVSFSFRVRTGTKVEFLDIENKDTNKIELCIRYGAGSLSLCSWASEIIKDKKTSTFFSLEHYDENQVIQCENNFDRFSIITNYADKFLFYLYKRSLYVAWKDENYISDEDLLIQVKAKLYADDKKFQALKKQVEMFEKGHFEEDKKQREPIPEEVKFEVWRRDQGRCVMCGSKENLEFDHIIPFSKGGATTARNLQLLCQNCNRHKSDKI